MKKWFFICFACLWMTACSVEQVVDLDDLQSRAQQGEQVAIEQLIDLLAKPDQDLSDRAYKIIVATGDVVVSSLLTRTDDADRQRREYVIAALGTLKVRQAIPKLDIVLADTQLERRYIAAWALGEIGDAAGVPILIKVLGDANGEVRRYATRALIKLNRLAVLPLIEHLETASGESAAGAIRALGDIADKRALEVLLAQAQGEQKAEAFLALGKLRDPLAESALIAGLSDPDSQVRMNAAMALGPVGGDVAATALQKILEDDVHVVREWSARSLEMITGQAVMYRNSHGEYVRPYQVYH